MPSEKKIKKNERPPCDVCLLRMPNASAAVLQSYDWCVRLMQAVFLSACMSPSLSLPLSLAMHLEKARWCSAISSVCPLYHYEVVQALEAV